ncbi:MAG: hypothetical protein EBR82_70420 [Caulobacteraceae bacterium]|nr:hypothetical protein [Caulobacteraceae bacterium]
MLIKDLPSTRKEVVLFKIQVQDLLCWKELPRAYPTLGTAMAFVPDSPARIVKRSDKGWQIVWSNQ